MGDRPKILWMSYRFPYGAVGGDILLTYKHLQGLNRWSDVYLFSIDEFGNASVDNITLLKKILGLKDVVCVPIDTKSWYTLMYNLGKSYFNDRPGQTELYFSKEALNIFKKYVDFIKPDIIIFQTIRMGRYIEETFDFLMAKNIKIIGFLVDAISLNYETALNYVDDAKTRLVYTYELERIKRYEHIIGNFCNRIIFVSNRDANYLRQTSTSSLQSEVMVVPNGVDTNEIRYKGINMESNKIIFVGNMRTKSNEDASIFFVKEIFPVIKRKIPEIEVCIIGANPSSKLLKLQRENEGITITGKVNDIYNHIANGRIAVVPIRFGAGMQNKVLEVAAVGIPQIVSKIVYEGVSNFQINNDLLVYETKQEMIDNIIAIWGNKSYLNFLSTNARMTAEKEYSWEKSWSILEKLILEN